MKLHRYTVYPNRHAFQLWGRVWEPPCIRRNVRRITWAVRFDDTARYTLPGADQRDWNKGGGISFDLMTNHQDSAMWAWRWNPEREVVQLTAYAHIEGRRVIARTIQGPDQTDPEVIAEVETGQTLDIALDISTVLGRYDFTFDTDDTTGRTWLPFEHRKRTGRTIGLWFGGNRAAPQRIDIYLTRKID